MHALGGRSSQLLDEEFLNRTGHQKKVNLEPSDENDLPGH
jgi:hypothetical protein